MLSASAGMPTMLSSGDTSSPSHVYSAGIAAPASNAGEVTPKGGGGAVDAVVSGAAAVGASVEVVPSSLACSEGEHATTRRATTSNRRIEENLPALC
jgi:hypothetical protein